MSLSPVYQRKKNNRENVVLCKDGVLKIDEIELAQQETSLDSHKHFDTSLGLLTFARANFEKAIFNQRF